MTADDRRVSAPAARHAKPGQVALRNILEAALVAELHAAVRRTDAQPRHRIDDHPQAFIARQ